MRNRKRLGAKGVLGAIAKARGLAIWDTPHSVVINFTRNFADFARPNNQNGLKLEIRNKGTISYARIREIINTLPANRKKLFLRELERKFGDPLDDILSED